MGGISLNEDCSHYFFSRYGQRIGEKELRNWVDQYADTQVKELLLNPNAMRTSYASRVWEPIWQGYDPNGGLRQPLFAGLPEEERERVRQWVHTAWQLDRDGIDPYAVWVGRSRERGLSPWLSMRMNDVHNVDNERHPFHSRLWRERPELRRITHRFAQWTDRAFDYGREEVRRHHLRLVQELLERYDADGLELDWMRSACHFRPGREAEGAELLTAFVDEVRQLLDRFADKRGHAIRLGVRVPSRPQTALGLGLDAVRWARELLVDTVVVTPFYPTIETDMPIELWRQLLDGTGAVLAAGLELMLSPHPGYPVKQTNSLETVRGAASAMLARGADRIYLFNYMDSETTIDDAVDYPRLLREVGDLETMRGKPRRHVVTYADTWAPGEPAAAALPAQCRAGAHVQFRLPVGPETPPGNLTVIAAWEQEGDSAAPSAGDCDVWLNGEPCDALGPAKPDKPRPNEPAFAYAVPLSAGGSGGYAVVDVRARHALTVKWLEIRVSGHAC
ncbi:MAG: hypothetical protein J7639_06250 [Paenibacillaceae bacterium]|nr:hypothetical protein [Paenibacillaceae bacterium]